MNKKILITLRLIAGILTILALSATVEAETKLYKWVDAQGRISYQGKPPPSNSKILSEETLKTAGTKKESTEKKVIRFKNALPVDVYINKNCPGCDQVVDLLETWEVPHNIKMINEHREIQKILIQETSTVGVPAVFYRGRLFSNTNTSDGLKQNLIRTEHIVLEAKSEESKEEIDVTDEEKDQSEEAEES